MSTEQSASRDLSADPARVWAVLTDLDHAADVFSDVSRVEKLTDGPFRIGTRWRETRGSATRELTVTDSEALGLIRVEADGDGAPQVTTYSLKALHPGTRLTISVTGGVDEEAGTLKKIAAKLGAPVADRAARKGVESDLDDIAQAVERR